MDLKAYHNLNTAEILQLWKVIAATIIVPYVVIFFLEDKQKRMKLSLHIFK